MNRSNFTRNSGQSNAARAVSAPTLRDALRDQGFEPPESIEPGRFIRFSTNGQRGDQASWVFLFPDEQGAVFGCWRAGTEFTWQAKRDQPLSPAEQAEFKRQIAEACARRDAEREQAYQAAAQAAQRAWESYTPAPPDTLQLVQRGIQPHGARITPEGRLALPVFSVNGGLQSLQYILPDREKRNYPGGQMPGGFWWLGMPTAASAHLLICASFSTAATLHEATGHPVYLSYGDSNLEAVARIAKAQFPAPKILLCGDDDGEKPGNPGRTQTEAAARALGLQAVFPDFGPHRPSGVTDFNDLAALAGLDEVRRQVEAKFSPRDPRDPPPFPVFDPAELDTAALHPRCIVENYLYANLALLCAAGGTGKTTTVLYEHVCIALGRPVWGLQVQHPGSTLFVTAEDSRELFAARLREIMDALALTPQERHKVLSQIGVWDVSNDLVRLAELEDGNIRLTSLADRLVKIYRNDPPAVIVFDPAIAFGPGERLINDGEQAIVTACRRIIQGLGCCVRLIHHTGKANARNGALDQYASRGGTALPDGCRMVAVLSSVKDVGDGSASLRRPEGFELAEGESGFILARAKLSYAAPQPNIWIKRRGHHFEYFAESRPTQEQRAEKRNREAEADAEAVYKFLVEEFANGQKHTERTLRDIAPRKLRDITRKRVLAALSTLYVAGRIADEDLSKDECQGRRKTFLNPHPKLAPIGPKSDGPIEPEPGR